MHSLVYSHTHIVRLRVSRGSELLDDEGGPYILAPISGRLRAHGKEVGHFVFSVQDDLGYVKLVTRFIGAPLVLRTDSGNVPVEGLLRPGPASIPDHGPVDYRGTTYEAYSFKAAAYPSGRLRVSLLLPLSRALASKSCDEIKAAELGLVAQRISRRFTLSPVGLRAVHQTRAHDDPRAGLRARGLAHAGRQHARVSGQAAVLGGVALARRRRTKSPRSPRRRRQARRACTCSSVTERDPALRTQRCA